MRPIPIDPALSKAAIGSRLRAVRQARQMTIEQLAVSAGLTKGFISRIERDKTSPSVSNLVVICDVLNTSIGELFATTDAQFVPRDEAPSINLGGRGAVEHLLSPRRESRFQVIHSRVEPGANGGDEPYTINCEVELLHVISGSVDVTFSDAAWSLSSGDSLTFDGREPHQWRSPGGAEMIWVIVPAAWSGTS